MKNSFRQFMADTDRRHRFQRRLISLLCVLSILVSASVSMMLTMPGITASYDPPLSNGVTELLTDNPSHNGWIDYFGISADANGNVSYNTEFVGSVWTDKSVFQSYTTSKNQTISAGTGNMLGVLSAIGSSMAITGRIRTPTDVMFILDMSSSMYGATNRNTATVQAMVDAVNESIATLLSLNEYNRIGVTVYWGNYSTSITNGSTTSHGVTLLPLRRYIEKSSHKYLTVTTDSNGLKGVSASAQYLDASGATKTESQTHNIPVAHYSNVAGTYAQLGVENARKQFLDIASDDTYIELNGEIIKRQPAFIFMSDGRPTAAHSDFSNLSGTSETGIANMAEWGLNTEANRTADATDFVFQLTSSYSKEMVAEHYDVEPLFYTLGLNDNKTQKVSMNVMDPMTTDKNDEEKTQHTTITGWWNQLIDGNNVTLNVLTNSVDYGWNYPLSTVERTVVPTTITRTDDDGSTYQEQFPSSISQMSYVDRYFPASGASDLSNAFTSIINEIILKSIYTPTYSTSNRENTSGEVSFVDQIGQYMEVKEIKGILMGGTLHSGAAFASCIINAEQKLGTLGNATAFGMAFWNNVIEQMGLDEVFDTVGPNGEEFGLAVPAVAETEKLIRAAYDAEQLYYRSDTDFSNYIGWYAGPGDNYLGFWDGSEDGAVPRGATQRIKTYFFQASVNSDDNQTMTTDMMYSTVWVKESIGTGDQTVVFSMPASLLPTLKYFVKLDVDGNLTSVHLGTVDADTVFNDDGSIKVRPIRLVYEVGLRSDINAKTLLDKVDTEYLEANTNEETGEVYFYSNEWERDTNGDGNIDDIGYGKKNTYSYFRPSRFNDRYYYLEDSYIYYKDSSGKLQLYTSDTKPQAEQDLYTLHPLYSRNGNTIASGEYDMELGDIAMESAVKDGNNNWYIPAGTPHSLDVNKVNRFGRLKAATAEQAANITQTLAYRNIPTQDDTGTVGEFILASTLGNNGRIAVAPSGQTLMKVLLDTDGVTPYVTDQDESFTFLLHEGDVLLDADGQPIDYNDGAAVWAALQGAEGTEDDRKVTLLTLQVKAGNSESARQMLYDLTEYTWQDNAWHPKASETPLWECQYLQAYTVVELYSLNRYDFLDIDETAGAHTFQYGVYPEGETDHTIYAGNQFTPWEVHLTKVDSEETANRIPGAVFGLYSPVESEGLTALPEGYSGYPLTTYNGQNWYLAKIATTDDNGVIVFDGLLQDSYLLMELEAADGYLSPVNHNMQVLYRSSAADLRVLPVSVSNVPGSELPSTGGSGSLPYIYIGAALMATAVVLMFVYEISKRKEERALKE